MYKSGHNGDQKPEAHMWHDTKAVLLHEMDEGTRLLVSAENYLDTGTTALGICKVGSWNTFKARSTPLKMAIMVKML